MYPSLWGEAPWGKPSQTIIVGAWATPRPPKWPPFWLWATTGLQQWPGAHQPPHIWGGAYILASSGHLHAWWLGAHNLGHSVLMLPVGHQPTHNCSHHPGTMHAKRVVHPFEPCRLPPQNFPKFSCCTGPWFAAGRLSEIVKWWHGHLPRCPAWPMPTPMLPQALSPTPLGPGLA